MFETLEKWKRVIASKWWGLGLVYFIGIVTVYTIIWSLIEPLNIPEKIIFLTSEIDRRILHIILSLLLGAHITLLLGMLRDWDIYNDEKRKLITPDFQTINSGSIPNQYLRKISPQRNGLILERVWMKDNKISQSAFASRVLLALNCSALTEKFARELLRNIPFSIKREENNIYTLIYESPQTAVQPQTRRKDESKKPGRDLGS